MRVSFPLAEEAPLIEVWRRRCEQLLALEEAQRERRLGRALTDAACETLGPRLAQCYQWRVEQDVHTGVFRQSVVADRVRAVRARWTAPRSSFVVREHPTQGRTFLAGAQPVRLDQALALRTWRVHVIGDTPRVRSYLAHQLDQQCMQRLVADLRDVAKVERVLAKRIKHFRAFKQRLDGHAFEQLVVDILNEEAQCARAAPLYEDLLEHTDVRVRYPELARRRGARVQITLVSRQRRLDDKVSRAADPDDLVIVSPSTLAQACLCEDLPTPTLALWDEIWSSGGEDGLTQAFKRAFQHALRAPVRRVGGPMMALPDALREWLRRVVKAWALDAREG